MTIRHWAEELVPQIGVLEKDTVSANFVDRLVRGAVSMGANRPRLLSAIHCTDAALRNPLGRCSKAVLVNLFAAIEREFGERSAGMKLSEVARPRCFSDLGFVALYAATVGDMIATTVDIQSFRQNVWQTRYEPDSDPARLTWILPTQEMTSLDAAIEFSMASYANLYRNSLPTPIRLEGVQFRHQPRVEIAIYEKIFGCPVVFGEADNVLFFDRNKLRLPSPVANPDLQGRLLAAYAQPMVWLDKGLKHSAFSYLYIASELNKSPLTLPRMAASFGLTERTLRRKLVDEGFAFRDLLEKVRRDLCALYALEGRRNLGEVAELLGYAELSAFTRAYRRWTGKPPSATWHKEAKS